MQFIISDIHGCNFTLQKLLEEVLLADSDAKFAFVGDYADRGKHSRQVIDTLLALEKEHHCDFLRGNHDDVLDWLLNGHALSNDTWTRSSTASNYQWWGWNGIIQTTNSYGVVYDATDDSLDKWKAAVPVEHKVFYNNTKLYWENDTHFACHAYMRPNEELVRDLKFMKNDRNDEALWSRFPKSPAGSLDVSCKIQWDKIGVFGHTPTSQYNSPTPIKYDKIRLIDTGAFLGEYLTAYCCEWDDWILRATDSRDIP